MQKWDPKRRTSSKQHPRISTHLRESMTYTRGWDRTRVSRSAKEQPPVKTSGFGLRLGNTVIGNHEVASPTVRGVEVRFTDIYLLKHSLVLVHSVLPVRAYCSHGTRSIGSSETATERQRDLGYCGKYCPLPVAKVIQKNCKCAQSPVASFLACDQ